MLLEHRRTIDPLKVRGSLELECGKSSRYLFVAFYKQCSIAHLDWNWSPVWAEVLMNAGLGLNYLFHGMPVECEPTV
jgi:hypothetical protein